MIITLEHSLPNLTEWVWLAYLPLAHILELASEVCMLVFGAKIGYSSPRRLKDSDCFNEQMKPMSDIRALRPTAMPTVPLVLDKLRRGIEAKIEKNQAVKILFKIAYQMKKNNYLRGMDSPWLDKFFFDQIKQGFGGRLTAMVSGGAPLSPKTQEFMNIVLGTPILQGYGLTETCVGGTLTHAADRTTGRVGAPLPCCELKLVDVPEMNYTHDYINGDGIAYPSGEIWIRGYNVTQGYFHNTEKVKQKEKKIKKNK